jgi:hypothetical protein
VRFAVVVPSRAGESKAVGEWHAAGWLKPKFRMRTKPCGRMCSKKRHRNSWTDRGKNFCLLWSAESRQRKVTWPSTKETRRGGLCKDAVDVNLNCCARYAGRLECVLRMSRI